MLQKSALNRLETFQALRFKESFSFFKRDGVKIDLKTCQTENRVKLNPFLLTCRTRWFQLWWQEWSRSAGRSLLSTPCSGNCCSWWGDFTGEKWKKKAFPLPGLVRSNLLFCCCFSCFTREEREKLCARASTAGRGAGGGGAEEAWRHFTPHLLCWFWLFWASVWAHLSAWKWRQWTQSPKSPKELRTTSCLVSPALYSPI